MAAALSLRCDYSLCLIERKHRRVAKSLVLGVWETVLVPLSVRVESKYIIWSEVESITTEQPFFFVTKKYEYIFQDPRVYNVDDISRDMYKSIFNSCRVLNVHETLTRSLQDFLVIQKQKNTEDMFTRYYMHRFNSSILQ